MLCCLLACRLDVIVVKKNIFMSGKKGKNIVSKTRSLGHIHVKFDFLVCVFFFLSAAVSNLFVSQPIKDV